MADHLRQQIRERIATNLTNLTTTGTNVFQSRIYAVQESELPCLLIYSKQETSELHSMASSRNILRHLTIQIDAIVQATSNSDDTLDLICKEVEVAMAGDISINSLAKDSFLQSVELSYMSEGKQPIAIASIEYMILYRNAENAPDVAT